MGSRRNVGLAAAAVAASLVATACGGGDDAAEVPQSGERGAPTTVEGDALHILVTNDDGVDAEGIDVLVSALVELDDVDVTVVAPAEDQSGTGGRTSEGPVTTEIASTAGGYDATAVDGFPSDAVELAVDDAGLEPDLVISGINEGQNLGPIVDISGTVGAARAAARQGVPALAVSQGRAESFDYEVAAELVVAWVEQHRDAIAAGDMPTDSIVNLNVPSCDGGELRGSLEVGLATEGDPVGTSDCTATGDGYTDDVTAFTDGYATVTDLPVEPGT